MSGRLALSNAIEEAGIPRDKAQRMASAIFDNVATKADIAPVATKVEAVAGDVRAVVRAELQAVRTELKDEMALLERRLLTRLGGLIVVVVGVLFTALRHWPLAGP